MRHFVLMLISCVCLCASASKGYARVCDFPYFSIDLPPAWSACQDGITMAFLPADKSALMAVTVELIEDKFGGGMNAEQLANAYAEEFHGSTPTMEHDDPNYYSFDFLSPEGIESEASIVVSGRQFYLITITGKHKDLAGMVESVLISIQ